MAARYDKYDGKVGGFRAAFASNWAEADQGKPLAVSLDANGRIVKGTAGQSGLVGVIVVDDYRRAKAGEIGDVMTSGEIVQVEGLAAGTAYFAAADGTIGTATGSLSIGHTVKADRLVVRVTKGAKA